MRNCDPLLFANLSQLNGSRPYVIAAEQIRLTDPGTFCRSSAYNCSGTDQHDVVIDKPSNVDPDK